MSLPVPLIFTSQIGTRNSLAGLIVTGWHGVSDAYGEVFNVRPRPTTFTVKARP